MELAIPAKQITGSTFTAGNVLKMNVMRLRNSKGDAMEGSTWSMGTPHNVDVFHPISFAAPRQIASGNRSAVNTALWKNGNFDNVDNGRKNRIPAFWKTNKNKYPAYWGFSSAKQYGGDMEYLLQEGSKTNYFIRLRQGFIFNRCDITSDVIRGSVKLRGKGTLKLHILRHMPVKNTRRFMGMPRIKTVKVDHADWKTYTFEYKRPGDKKEIQLFTLWPEKDSRIDVDDLYLAPK